MLCWFLAYNNANMYIYTFPLEPPSSLPPPIPSLYVVIEHQTGFPVLHSNFSPVTYVTHNSVYMLTLLPPFIPLCTHGVHKSIFYICVSIQFSSVQLPSRVWFFETPWTAACQASLSITSLPKLMSTESVMLSNHLILCRPLLLPSIFPSTGVFSNEFEGIQIFRYRY